jgi:hypothetical protein
MTTCPCQPEDNVNRHGQILAMRELLAAAGRKMSRAISKYKAYNGDDATEGRLFTKMDDTIKEHQRIRLALTAAEKAWHSTWVDNYDGYFEQAS